MHEVVFYYFITVRYVCCYYCSHDVVFAVVYLVSVSCEIILQRCSFVSAQI